MSDVIKLEKKGDIDVITFLKDEVNIIENDNVKTEILKLIKGGSRKLLIDFSKVKFISSIVLASLISCLKEIKSANGVLKLCSMNDKVKGVFYVTELHKIFEIYETKDHALDAFPKHAI